MDKRRQGRRGLIAAGLAALACTLSLSGIAALPLLPFVGRYFDRTYRVNPAKALAMVGALILPSALFTPIQYSVHSSTAFWILGVPQAVLTTSAFAVTALGSNVTITPQGDGAFVLRMPEGVQTVVSPLLAGYEVLSLAYGITFGERFHAALNPS